MEFTAVITCNSHSVCIFKACFLQKYNVKAISLVLLQFYLIKYGIVLCAPCDLHLYTFKCKKLFFFINKQKIIFSKHIVKKMKNKI